MKALLNLFSNTPSRDLKTVDDFYRTTVSQLCPKARRQYCINLLGRLKDDLKRSRCQVEIRALNQRLQATHRELEKLAP